MCACCRGDDLTALTLLRSGADTDICVPFRQLTAGGWTALCFAVSQGHLSIVKVILTLQSKYIR